MPPRSATADIQRYSARVRRFVTGLLWVLGVLLVLERFSAVTIELVTRGAGGEPARRLAYELVAACPEVLYLVSLWCVRQALAAFARGDLYAPVIARMLERVGALVAVGVAAEVLVVPGAGRLLGFGPGYWIAYDVSALVLGAIGLSLHVIARVLRRAAAQAAELAEIF